MCGRRVKIGALAPCRYSRPLGLLKAPTLVGDSYSLEKFNKTVAKMAPYMATTCKGLISCAISPLNQGLKKSSIQGLQFYHSRSY